MKFDLQKAITTVPLAEYSAAYKDAGDPQLHVWVNLPRAKLQEREDLDNEYTRLFFRAEIDKGTFSKALKAAKDDKAREKLVTAREKEQAAIQAEFDAYKLRSHAWFSELWSQGPEGTHWPVDDILALEDEDHMLLGWMADRTRELLKTRRIDQKKE